MGILMYVPGYSGGERDELVRRGLADLLEPGIDVIPTPIVKGPDGQAGTLFTCWPGSDPREVDTARQTWLEAPPDGEQPKGRYWLGYVTANRPMPEELQRKDLIDGEPVVLADNRVWVVPCCEFAPKRITRHNDTGEETRVVKTEHEHWVNWSNALYSLFVSDGFQAIVEKERIVHIPNGLGYAALCLAKNYRVNADVIDLLGLIGEYEAFEIARVATGMALMERLLVQKKSTEPSCPPASPR